jgi:acid stress-induced BolA-like protein IbaG/YrbA
MIAPKPRTLRQFLAARQSFKITPMNPEQVAELISAALPEASVQVRSDDNTHYAARVIGAAFVGLRTLARHQLIYRALGERMGREIHALSIEAYTPEEWSARARRS